MSSEFSQRQGVLLIVLQYSLWLLTVALAILDMLVARHLLLAAYVALRLGKWTFGLLDKAGTVIIGLLCLILVFLAEDWYRRSANIGLGVLVKWFAVVTAGQVAFGLLARYLV